MYQATLTPAVKTTVLDDFFGQSGSSETALGATLSKIVAGVNVSAEYKHRFGHNENTDDDQITVGLSIPFSIE